MLYTDTDTVLAQYHVKDPGHSAKSAGGRLQSKRITLLLTERGVAGGGGESKRFTMIGMGRLVWTVVPMKRR